MPQGNEFSGNGKKGQRKTTKKQLGNEKGQRVENSKKLGGEAS